MKIYFLVQYLPYRIIQRKAPQKFQHTIPQSTSQCENYDKLGTISWTAQMKCLHVHNLVYSWKPLHIHLLVLNIFSPKIPQNV